MTVTKAHIVDFLYMTGGFSKEEAARVVDSLFEIVKRTLEGGEDVIISRFGKFCVKDKGKRGARKLMSVDIIGYQAICDTYIRSQLYNNI